jgi:hypothetical protein
MNSTNHVSNPNIENKIIINDLDTTSLRLEIVEFVKTNLELGQIATPDFQEFEKEIIINGILEGLVKLKNRADIDSSRRVSKIIIAIIESKYNVLASKKNKFLKIRDLTWDRVFGVMFEIELILKSKPALLKEMLQFIEKIKEKCPYPYQYYWALEAKSKDPRAKLIPEEEFLLSYFGDYNKAINRNTKEFTSFYHKAQRKENGFFGIRKAIKGAIQTNAKNARKRASEDS